MVSRTRFIFILTVVLVLSAGVVVGRLWAKLPTVAPRTSGGGPSWVADELQLNSQQRQQMDAVWADTRQKIGKTFEQRHNLEKQRDAAVQNLLTTEQKASYESIMNTFRSQRSDLDQQRDKLIHSAEERSRALLDETQKTRFDELTRQMHNRHHHGPGGDSSPTSSPATQPREGH